ncbi:hypothetical protein CFIMG_007937RA00001 [Ceratocystis fimbriata CBS 114723]|uniref:Uncharacterized protein n=1 Tax=Ceratocystis fimbriata CBS 114723 TaxID=1035309 RepID=A0A2C5XBU9_9PEZI|nr:hypothetical protein CFIMG_007937RA00001 [Ceratocystis fimbriata CBS 114723]
MMSAASFVHYNRRAQNLQRSHSRKHRRLDCNSHTLQPNSVFRSTSASSSPSPFYQQHKPQSAAAAIATAPWPVSSPSASTNPSISTSSPLDYHNNTAPPSSLSLTPPPQHSSTESSSSSLSRPSSTPSYYPASINYWKSNYDQSQQPEPSPTFMSTIVSSPFQSCPQVTPDNMAPHDGVRSMTQPILMKLPGRSTPTSTTGPVQIPTKVQSDARNAKSVKRKSSTRSSRSMTSQTRPRPLDVHSPGAVPASVATLLAMTDIPKPRRHRSQRRSLEKDVMPLTVSSIIERVTDTELSFKLSKTSLDMLLLPPDEAHCELGSSMSIYDSDTGSTLGPRTDSLDSVPSLADSFVYGTPSSVGSSWGGCCKSERSVSRSRSRSNKQRPTRPSLEPISSPSGESEAHPLSKAVTIDELDFRIFSISHDDDSSSEAPKKPATTANPFPSMMRSAFKSNLTASLRAIRNAAKSISNINLSSIPPDDFLTRSIFAIDPKVPFTDERRPPVLEEEPSAALRRYLNPTSSARIEPRPASDTMATMQNPLRPYTASIQMQTYKVYKSRNGSRSAASATTRHSSSLSAAPSSPSSPTADNQAQTQTPSSQSSLSQPAGAMRQREIRENPDFIRVAVLEMAMRRNGKFDESHSGRARWTLPPRKPTRICEVTIDGIPERWVPKVAA